LRDAVLCSEQGVPAAAVVTTPFEGLARMTAMSIGVPQFDIMVIEHPIWTRDAAWMEATAEKLAKPLIEKLFTARVE
jgi:hypothetical protein